MPSDIHPSWRDQGSPRRPTPAAVHIWMLPLEISGRVENSLWSILSDDERVRANRFLAEKHRRRFVACRGRVRLILAEYLGQPADQIEFEYSGLGKPSLKPSAGDEALAFNVTHSSELALLAVGANGELGLDVERRRDVNNMHGLAERFFSKQESSGLFQLQPAAQPEAFFRIWTRKEAILKATGKGLTYPLDQLTVSFREDEPAALLSLGDDPAEAEAWTLQHLSPHPDYIAAVATRYAPRDMEYWLWRDAE